MAVIAVVAVCVASGLWSCWELLTNGIYRDGFFNMRLIYGAMIWTGLGFAAMFWLQSSI
jgi:hypothetical protein